MITSTYLLTSKEERPLLTIDVTQCTAPALSVSVNAYNQISSSGFSYDNAGNLLSGNSVNYTWNGEGLLKSAGSATYTYDGDDKRVMNSAGTYFWPALSGDQLSDTPGSQTGNEYIFFAGRRIAWVDSTGIVRYYWGDQIGSTRMITDGSGNICYDADYYPFQGERTPYVSTCTPAYKFAGMKYDGESGNYYTLNRYYPPNLGRWMSPDPLAGDITNPQSLNRYAYVMNNPTSYVDPLGLHVRACPPGEYGTSGCPVSIGDTGWLNEFAFFEPTALGFAYPSDLPEGIWSLAGLEEQGLGSGFFFLIYGNLDLADFGWLLTGQAQFQVMTDAGSTTVTSTKGLTQSRCSGSSRVLSGNPNFIGESDKGIPGATITAGSTAVIPSQWGGKRPLSLVGSYVFGVAAISGLNGFIGFSGVTDAVGSKDVPNVQKFLQNRFPGSLILELNNLPQKYDSGVPTFAAVSVPQPMPCPSGTSPF